MLSKSAQSIQDFLTAKGVKTSVVELPDSTRTARDAAKAIGCQVAQIVKSLIFRAKQSNKPILVLASGINRVNLEVISKLVGQEIEKADADFTREVTGFAIGGVPPVGHKTSIETIIDKDLLKFKTVWAAAGTPHAVFSLDSVELEALTGGKIASII